MLRQQDNDIGQYVVKGSDHLTAYRIYEDVLTTLNAAGIPVGIVSNAIHEPFLEWAVEAAGMHGLFDSILTSARAGYYKSRPEIYLQAAHEPIETSDPLCLGLHLEGPLHRLHQLAADRQTQARAREGVLARLLASRGPRMAPTDAAQPPSPS